MKKVRIGRYSLPIWILGVVLVGICLGVFASYKLLTILIPFEVKEPLEILYYPSRISLYPGETKEFNVTIENHASLNYTVTLNFSLENGTYQERYVTFSNETYSVVPGEQNLTAWIKVELHAPAIETTLKVLFQRIKTVFLYTLSGGTNPTIPFDADDDLIVELNGKPIFVDNDNVITTISPIKFYASPGDSLRIIGINEYDPTYGIKSHTHEGIYLHCEGKMQKLFDEIRVEWDGIGVFFDETFIIQIP